MCTSQLIQADEKWYQRKNNLQCNDYPAKLKEMAFLFSLWITRSVSNKLLWALRYANMSLRDVDTFRYSVGSARKRPISKRQLS